MCASLPVHDEFSIQSSSDLESYFKSANDFFYYHFPYIGCIQKRGLENVTVNDLVTEITPVGRRLVPDSVKQELVDAIRAFLPEKSEENEEDDDEAEVDSH